MRRDFVVGMDVVREAMRQDDRPSRGRPVLEKGDFQDLSAKGLQGRHVFIGAKVAPLPSDRRRVPQPAIDHPELGRRGLCSVRVGQGAVGAHFRLSRMRALARMRSFLIMATRATLAGFPALIRAWYLVLSWGLNRMALRAAI